MNTARLLEKLFQVCIHEKLSEENEQYLQWIQELLSMFDFLWNHSDFFLETIDVPSRKTDKIYGSYNTVYAQFLKRTFDETRKFKDILMTVHSMSLSEFLKMRISDGALSTGKYIFHNRNASPVAEVYWQYSIYPYQVLL